MEFGDKYELLESLTTGAVETFIANDKVKGERVLVHILHCEAQKPNQPTFQWVLEGFRKVAPEPAGLVLETGKYSGTLYAYLVTKLPDDGALRAWVSAYNGETPSPRKVTRPDVKMAPNVEPPPPPTPSPTIEIPVPAPATPAKPPAQVPVQFTQMFRTLDSQGKIGTPPADSGNAEPIRRPLPSLDNPGHPSGVMAPPPAWDGFNTRSSRIPKDDLLKENPKVVAPTSAFSTDYGVKNGPPEPSAHHPVAKSGEFTSFFQGPFRPDVPADLPPVVSAPIEPPRKSAGDFTQMFGPANSPTEASIVPATPPRKETPSTGFTGWFSDPGIMTRTPDAPVSGSPITPVAGTDSPPMVSPPAKEPIVSVTPIPAPPLPLTPPSPVAPPPMPSPVVQKASPMARPVSSAPEGATGTFSTPSYEMEPSRSQPAPPAGPSPYTQIISMKNLRLKEETEEGEEAGNSKGSEFPEFSKPKAPKLSAPSAPKMKAPAPPKDFKAPKDMKAPKAPKDMKAPKAPKVDPSKLQGAKPAVSQWPLIITLTVLFCLAVLLILYFVLKH